MKLKKTLVLGRVKLLGLLMSLVICLGLPTYNLAMNTLAPNANGSVNPGDLEMTNFVKPGNYFSCDLPRHWGALIDEWEEKRIKVFGIFLIGPVVVVGVPATISVRYFSKDNSIFKSEEEYLRRNAFPSLILGPLKGEKFGSIQSINLAGRQARTFDRETFDYYPPHSLDTIEIPVKERIVVIPAQEDGFYVLLFKAPTSIFAQYALVFEKVLQSFKPGP